MKFLTEKVRIGQVYQSLRSNTQVEIFGKHGSKWKSRVLTAKPGVYRGTHTLSEKSIGTKFKKIS